MFNCAVKCFTSENIEEAPGRVSIMQTELVRLRTGRLHASRIARTGFLTALASKLPNGHTASVLDRFLTLAYSADPSVDHALQSVWSYCTRCVWSHCTRCVWSHCTRCVWSYCTRCVWSHCTRDHASFFNGTSCGEH